MTNTLHLSSQETSSGNGASCPCQAFVAQNLIITVSQISLGVLGNVSFKVQHSADQSTWIDVPNLSTGSITATGATTVSLSPSQALLDYQRIVWTFNNANSVTFSAYLLGTE